MLPLPGGIFKSLKFNHQQGHLQMAPQYIRPISIGIFQKENSILVFEGYDKVDKENHANIRGIP